MVFTFFIVIELFKSPHIVLIRVFIITETRDFLLTRNGANNLMRVEVGTISHTLKTDFIFETDFVTSFFVSNSRRDNNPSTLFTRRTFYGKDLFLRENKFLLVLFLSPKTYLLLERSTIVSLFNGSEITTGSNMLERNVVAKRI